MKTTRCFIALIVMIFLMFVGLALHTTVHAKTSNDSCTFDFEKSTVSDALQQIMRITGVKIRINKPFDKAIVGKSYQDADLENILRDLFWQENVAIEWRYVEAGLESVNIKIYDKQKDQRPSSPSTAPFSYGSNVAGGLPVISNNQASIFESATMQRGNNQVIDNRKGQMSPSAIITTGWQISAAALDRAQMANYQMNNGSKVQNQTSISGNRKASIPISAPPVKHGLEPPPMPPGFANR